MVENSMPDRLQPVRLKPKEGEMLSSWLAGLAVGH